MKERFYRFAERWLNLVDVLLFRELPSAVRGPIRAALTVQARKDHSSIDPSSKTTALSLSLTQQHLI